MIIGMFIGMLLMFLIIAFMIGRDVDKNEEDYSCIKPTLAITILCLIAMAYCYGLGYIVKENEVNQTNTTIGETN